MFVHASLLPQKFSSLLFPRIFDIVFGFEVTKDLLPSYLENRSTIASIFEVMVVLSTVCVHSAANSGDRLEPLTTNNLGMSVFVSYTFRSTR